MSRAQLILPLPRMLALLPLLLGCDPRTLLNPPYVAPADLEVVALAAGPNDVAYHTCPMHPSIRQPGPGSCPICGMTLLPVLTSELQSGAVLVDSTRRERFGIATEPVTRRSMGATLELPAVVAWDQSRLADVTLKVSGWVESEAVGAPGVHVRAGQTLFSLYSPELVAAQDDLLRATTSDQRGESGAGERAVAARLRLTRWGMTDGQLDSVLERGTVLENVPILAPISGFVLEKTTLVGAMVSPGQTIYRIGDTSRVWLEASVPEAQLALFRPGLLVDVYLPGVEEPRSAKITLTYPTVDPATRTARVRVELQNSDGALRPDQWATLKVRLDVKDRLVVPESAVIYTGPRRMVFVDTGEDRLEPRDVTIGVKAGGYVEVLTGLKEGDMVVTAGNYLVAADSRLKQGGEAAPAQAEPTANP